MALNDKTIAELWRWRLSASGPPIETAATFGEAARAMAMRASQCLFKSDVLEPCLHGPESADPDGRHLHARWLGEDRDGDGRIDHLSIFAEGGIWPRSRIILAACREIRSRQWPSAVLTPVAVAAPPDPPARVWRSVTPYVTPDFAQRSAASGPKPGKSASEQLLRELHAYRRPDFSSLPTATVIEDVRPELPAADRFRLGGRGLRGAKSRARGWFTLVFAEPVTGPLAFGFGAHFGLGQFSGLRDASGR